MSTNTKDLSDPKPFQRRPFDQSQNADIIIQSSNGDQFYTLRALFSLTSEIFDTMFTLPQGEARSDEPNLPVISLTEDSAALYQLLLWLDPRCQPSFKLKDMQAALCAADKYTMHGVMGRIEQVLLMSGETIKAHPIKVYAIAIRYNFTRLARLAAKESLSIPLEERHDIPELAFISARDLQRLQTYYFACGKVANQIATDFKLGWIGQAKFVWLGGSSGFHSLQCSSLQVEGRWWQQWGVDYMKLAAEELRKRPRGITIERIPPFAAGVLEVAVNCAICQPKVHADMARFNEIFSSTVEKKIAEINLVIG